MWRAARGRFGAAITLAGVALGLSSPAVRAQEPEFTSLGGGTFPSLDSTWRANAVQPNTTLLDLYDNLGILYQSYSSQFEAPGKRGLSAVGQRPLGLPSAAALVAGVAGTKVRTVKIVFLGAPVQRLRTVAAPPGWGFRGRFFAAGANLAESAAATNQVVTRVRGFDRRGRRVASVNSVFTNPF